MPSLSGLATRVRRLHRSIVGLGKRSTDLAIEAGKLLAKAKKALKHGEWLPWLASVNIKEDSARRYMRLAKFKSRKLRDLPLCEAYVKAGILAQKDDEPPVSIDRKDKKFHEAVKAGKNNAAKPLWSVNLDSASSLSLSFRSDSYRDDPVTSMANALRMLPDATKKRIKKGLKSSFVIRVSFVKGAK